MFIGLIYITCVTFSQRVKNSKKINFGWCILAKFSEPLVAKTLIAGVQNGNTMSKLSRAMICPRKPQATEKYELGGFLSFPAIISPLELPRRRGAMVICSREH